MSAIRRRFLELCRQPTPAADPLESPRYRRVLFTPVTGMSENYLVREGLIAHGLRLRGCDVRFLVCDASIPVCNDKSVASDREGLCEECSNLGSERYSELGLPVFRWADLIDGNDVAAIREKVSPMSIDEILSHREHGIDYGRLVWSGFLRYQLSGRMPEHGAGDRCPLLAAFLETCLIANHAMRALFELWIPDKVFTSHGYYPVWGTILHTAVRRGVAVDSYNSGEIRNTLRLAHDEPSSPIQFDRDWAELRDAPLAVAERDRVRSYFELKEANRYEFIRYHDGEDPATVDRVATFLDRHRERKIACAYTNVMWDAITAGQNGAFPDMIDWLHETVEQYRDRSDTALILRIHPGEVTKPEQAAQRVVPLLRQRFGTLPESILVIDAEDRFHTSRLYDPSYLHLVYLSTVGLEVALRGGTAITAGRSSFSHEPIVLVAETRERYRELLEQHRTGRLDFRPDVGQAERFAYLHYFRKCIPFEPLDVNVWTIERLFADRLDDLLPGRFPGFDTVCDGIAHGASYRVREAETEAVAVVGG